MSTPIAATPAVKTYSIDPSHSNAHFKVRHLMISNVRGEFSKVSGTVVINEEDHSASSIAVEIDVNSINTREPQRDAHLKSADFLNAEQYPVIRFQSKNIEPDGRDAFKVTGDLTIHGATREEVLEVVGLTPEAKDPWGYARRGAEATTKISRKDFGLTWNQLLETGGVMVGDHVEITIDVEMVRPA